MLLLFIVVSCSKDNNNIPPSGGDPSNLLNSRISVTVEVCDDLFCNEKTALSGVEVRLKAPGSDSNYRMASTDESGKVDFSSININELTIEASYDGQEYMRSTSIGKDEILYENILFSPFCEMQGASLVNCNRKLDFERMSVGQVSRYALYKTNEIQLDDDKSFFYTGDTLVLTVTEQIDETSWLVKEEFTQTLQDSMFDFIVNTEPAICVWEVTDEFVKIYPTTGNNPSNFTPIYDEGFEDYEIPLVATGLNICAMDLWYPKDCPNGVTPSVFGAEFNGKVYTSELILDRRNGIDIPQFGILLNKEEGIVHTYSFGVFPKTAAYGFDIIDN